MCRSLVPSGTTVEVPLSTRSGTTGSTTGTTAGHPHDIKSRWLAVVLGHYRSSTVRTSESKIVLAVFSTVLPAVLPLADASGTTAGRNGTTAGRSGTTALEMQL